MTSFVLETYNANVLKQHPQGQRSPSSLTQYTHSPPQQPPFSTCISTL